MTVYAYSRVSTDDQTTDNQILEVVQAGYQVAPGCFFADVGVSGSVPASERPQWAVMLPKLASGDVLVVSKIDRLGRNAVDILSTVDLMSEKGVKVNVLQLGGIDLTSSSGRMMLTMLSAMAEFERSLIVERTKAGLERAKAEGKTLGAKPKDRDEVYVLFTKGTSNSEISRITGISRPTLIKWRKEWEEQQASD